MQPAPRPALTLKPQTYRLEILTMAMKTKTRHQIPETKMLGVPTGPWATSPGAYIAGSSAVDGMDAVARELSLIHI